MISLVYQECKEIGDLMGSLQMTQTEYYKRYNEDENEAITDKEYDKAEKYLEALQKISKDWFND